MKLRPLADYVLVKRIEAETTTPGGILIPDTAQEKNTRATVLAVGPGRVTDKGVRVEPQVKKGDVVLLSKWGGTDVKGKSELEMLVKESDILGIEEP